MRRTTVVVGVDGSPESVRAAALGVALARAAGTECRLVHAVPGLGRLTATSRITLQQVRREVRERLRRVLREVVPPSVLARLHVGAGRAGGLLADEARRHRAWVVVVGGKHHGAMVRGVGGSTAHHLIRTLRIPVLVTGPSDRPVERVLVAVDLSAAADPTLRQAARLARLTGAELKILHVIEPIRFPMVVPLAPDEARFARESEVGFEKLARRAGLATTPRAVRRGEAVQEVTAEAVAWGAEVVVVGSHGKGWAHRLLIGSTTEALLDRLPATLLVVPAPAGVASGRHRARRVARVVI